MLDKEQILENHKKRIKRAGPKLWAYLRFIDQEDGPIPGIKCLELCNTYGLRMIDFMLFLDAIDVEYDFDEWYRLEQQQDQIHKEIKLCQ